MHFRLLRDSVAGFAATENSQTFDIPPFDHEQIDIVFMDETVENNTVDFLYAIAKTRITVPQRFFPHVLKVRVTANEIKKPVDRTFTIYITRNGILEMIEGLIGEDYTI